MRSTRNPYTWFFSAKKIFSSETPWPNGTKLGRKHLCKVLYKVSSLANEKQELLLADIFVVQTERNEETL
jgi:hypothetical protein